METIDFNKKIETLLEKAKANDSEAQDELLTWFPFFDNYYEERIDFDLYENLYEYLKKFLDDNFEFILCNHKKDMDANFILLMLKTNVYHDLFDFESWYQELYEKVDNRFDYQGDLDIFDVIRYKNKWECYDVQESYKKLLAYYGDEYYANEGYKIGPRNDLKLAIMYIKIESNNENANHILLQQADCYAFGIGVIKDVKKARNLCFELIYDFEQAYYYKYDHWYDYDYRKCNDDLINAAKIKLVSFCFFRL